VRRAWTIRGASDKDTETKLARFLSGRGFSHDAIKAVLLTLKEGHP